MAKDINGETLHFGDVIRNGWAGNRNPHKITMFIKATKRFFNWIALDGTQGQTYRDNNRVEKVGELDLGAWRAIAENTTLEKD